MINRAKKRIAKIGIFGVGHDVYWAQFNGLLEKLIGYHKEFEGIVKANEVEVVDFGITDNSISAYKILEKIQKENLDLIFCNMLTYATSSTFAPIIKNVQVPVILAALQPRRALDYTKASTFMQLENDNICSVPEFTGVAVRMGKKIDDVIIGSLYDDSESAAAVKEWCDIAKVLHDLKGARIGYMGHVLEAMYDMHTDLTAISAAFDVHVPLLEIDDLVQCYKDSKPDMVAKEIEIIKKEFDFPDPKSDPITRKLTENDLETAARCAVALKILIKKHRLDGLAYYYEGEKGSLQREVSSSLIVGNSLLIGAGFPICGEADIKTNIAMLIMDRLDIGGSFAEFHPFDFNEDFILVGHDGPHHINIAEGKPALRTLIKYHGKPGSGASVEFKLKEGPITMLGIASGSDGKFKFVIGEGYSKKGPIPPTGNTNTRGYFKPNTRAFIKAWVLEGPTHHYALGIGHHAKTIKKIADVLRIESVIVEVK